MEKSFVIIYRLDVKKLKNNMSSLKINPEENF